MADHYKMFKIDGRTPETDKLAEELAAHAVRDAHPTVQSVTFTWTRHNQPDHWLLFAVGHEEAPSP